MDGHETTHILQALHALETKLMASTERLETMITTLTQTVADETAAIKAILEADMVDQEKIDQAVARLDALNAAVAGMVP
jgi:hypothetical protein